MDVAVQQHFARVATRYRRLRSLDERAAQLVAQELGRLAKALGRGAFRILDVGSGTGRYLEAVVTGLRRAGLHAIRGLAVDASRPMLRSGRSAFRAAGLSPGSVAARGEALPLRAAALDAVLCFNAIHHFALDEFAHEAARVLRSGGRLVLYTRTPTQNRRTVWGLHYSGFAKRERRLYTKKALVGALAGTGKFVVLAAKTIRWLQRKTLDELLVEARQAHYSTLALYEGEERRHATAEFRARLLSAYPDPTSIPNRNHHLLVIAAAGPAAV